MIDDQFDDWTLDLFCPVSSVISDFVFVLRQFLYLVIYLLLIITRWTFFSIHLAIN